MEPHIHISIVPLSLQTTTQYYPASLRQLASMEVSPISHKVKLIMMQIGSLRTNLPHTLINPINLPTSYDMIFGINFVRSIRGGLTIMPSGLMIHKQIITVPLTILILSQSVSGIVVVPSIIKKPISFNGKKIKNIFNTIIY